jgi:hypothetical protein
LKGVHYQRSLVQKFEELYGSIAETTFGYLHGTVLGADESRVLQDVKDIPDMHLSFLQTQVLLEI